ncbi:helix-turn-helix domain-containing protein [Pelomonas sp. CA6]|uniref:DNA-3-methyladenine glycosylase 2 family protein n=1 Tax=Pelomonas sp. CA6 TaxID=2907999 RepID=UPI001F4C33C7|nr:Ada metal-binding domain-containing protein [Pelomonas sp. CA6]MCH7345551.1 helix-turn-helix domain-containing protein [Pelomonas sp. CA6]
MDAQALPRTQAPEDCYPALVARDARFDGLWFVGVTSTGIYCRPVCRVRTPKRENCLFFASAAQAEAANFRPCLKCRPELAPREDGPARWSVMDASRTLARQAAEWLDACDDPEASVEQLADRLGITSRHLRRIFAAEHGVTPLQYLQTRRLLLAKQLLTDTALPVAQVALAAGFGSVRRFNAAFAQHYRLQPGQLRREMPAAVSACGEPALRLAYRPPYAVEAMLQFLADRAIPGVEAVDLAARRIERSLRLQHRGEILQGRLTLSFDREQPLVLLSPCSALWNASAALIPLVRRWLDLDARPDAIDRRLGQLAEQEPGLRLPGCCDRFELAVRAVLGQQVTVAAARTLAGRLVARFGAPLPEDQCSPQVTRLFPRPDVLAGAEVSAIAELGIIRQRAEALIAIARAWPELAFARGEGPPQQALDGLVALPGIGPWTAHYMLMRGWSWPDIFPPGDIVLRRRLSPDAQQPLPSARISEQAAERFQPYRSYAVLRLWRQAALDGPARRRPAAAVPANPSADAPSPRARRHALPQER